MLKKMNCFTGKGREVIIYLLRTSTLPLLFVVIWCNKSYSQPFESFQVDLSKGNEVALWTDFFEVLDVIELSFDPKKPVEYIEEVIETESGLYLLDGMFGGNKVHYFSKEGIFKSLLGTSADGPGSFVIPYDIDIDSNKGEIHLLDGERLRINIYDATTADFLKYHTIPLPAIGFSITADREYLLYNPSAELGSYFVLLNLNDGVKNSYFPVDNAVAARVDNHIVEDGNHKLFFRGGFDSSGKIFSYDGLTFSQKYEFDFGKYSLTTMVRCKFKPFEAHDS